MTPSPSFECRVRITLGRWELDVDVTLGSGTTALLGPNGAGKTTFLRILTGATRPREGRLKYVERIVFDSSSGIEVPPEERQVGYVPQGHGLFPHLSVLDNVAFGLPRSDSRARRRERAMEVLTELDADKLASRMPRGLSGGEAQRVALARALAPGPRLLILDEPLSSLDTSARRSVRRTLAEHLERFRIPSLIVTHDVRDVYALASSAFVLEAGRVTQRGRIAELQSAPASDFVAEFFGVDL